MRPEIAVERENGDAIDLAYVNSSGRTTNLTASHRRLLRYFVLSLPSDLYERSAGAHRGKRIAAEDLATVLGSDDERNRASSYIQQFLEQARAAGSLEVTKDVIVDDSGRTSTVYALVIDTQVDSVDWLDCLRDVGLAEQSIARGEWAEALHLVEPWRTPLAETDLDTAFEGREATLWTSTDRQSVEGWRRRLDRITAIATSRALIVHGRASWHSVVLELVDRFFEAGQLAYFESYDSTLAEAAVRARFGATADIGQTLHAVDNYFFNCEVELTGEIQEFVDDEKGDLNPDARADKWKSRWLARGPSARATGDRGTEESSRVDVSPSLASALSRHHRRLAHFSVAPTTAKSPQSLPIWTFHVPLRSDIQLSGRLEPHGFDELVVSRRAIGLETSDQHPEILVGPLERPAISAAVEPRLHHLELYAAALEKIALDGAPDETGFIDQPRRPLICAPPWQRGWKDPAAHLDLYTAVAMFHRSAVIGGPGSGKSTFLRYLSIWHGSRSIGSTTTDLPDLPTWGSEVRVPFYCELRAFVSSPAFPDDLGVSPTPDDFIGYLQEVLSLDDAAVSEVEALFDQGSALLLLDGLDEVPIPPDDELGSDRSLRRSQLRNLIHELATTFPRLRIIVTARTAAYPRWALTGFEPVNIAPLDQRAAEALARRLYAATGFDGGTADDLSRELARELWRSESVLREHPLFLSLTAGIFSRRDGVLPSSRSELLLESTERLLDKWTDPGYGGTPLPELLGCSKDELLDALAAIATDFIDHESDTASERLGMILTGFFRLGRRLNPTEVLEFVTERAGILVALDEDDYRFIHRQIEEVLAARHLRSTSPDLGAALGRRLAKDVDAWRVVAALSLEMTHDEGSPAELADVVMSALPELTGAPAGLVHLARAYAEMREPNPTSAFARTVDETIASSLEHAVGHGSTASPSLLIRADAFDTLGLLGSARQGTSLVDGVPDIAWCEIPGGEFGVGLTPQDVGLIAAESSDGEWDFSREMPHHKVSVAAFRISRFPVTVAQFQAFVGVDGGYFDEQWWQGLTVDGTPPSDAAPPPNAIDSMPQIAVSWIEAAAFCRWLSQRLELRVRLPTEPEWEVAARGRRQHLFPWGNAPAPDASNVLESGLGRLIPVGAAGTESAWDDGPVDMIGNCWEWCSSAPGPGSDFVYPYDQSDGREEFEPGRAAIMRVTRGGYFGFRAWYARSTYRGRDFPSLRAPRQGFRLATSIPTT